MFGAFDFYSKAVLVPWTGAGIPFGDYSFPSSNKGILIKNSDAVARIVTLTYYTQPFIDEFDEIRNYETTSITVAPTSNLILPIRMYSLSRVVAPNGIQIYELY
jgi:hypothetical protein